MTLHKMLFSAVLSAAFILGSCKGYLALWEEGDPDPLQIFPLQISTLPEADREALEEGIRAVTRQELDQLLEDFLS